VINADPSCPPLSLFVLLEMLKQRFSVLATSYVHSSVKDVDPRFCYAITSGSQVTRGNHQIAVSVVWKKGEIVIHFVRFKLIKTIKLYGLDVIQI